MNKQYYEVVVEGPLDLAKGFVMGFLAGRGIEGSAFFDEVCHIAGDDAAGPLIRLLEARDDESTLIVGAGLYDLLAAALNRRPQAIALGIKKVRQVLGAAFTCAFRTYSREVGEKLQDIFACIPEGVDGDSEFELREKTDPAGKGVELFTPLHDYELAGKGRISGSVRGVLDLYQRLKRFEVVELGELELAYGNTLPPGE